MGLADTLGEFSYRETDFLAIGEGIVTSVEMTPVLDAARRQVVYDRYVVSAEMVLQDATNGTDSAVESLRRQLSLNGGEFHYDDRGYGTTSLAVNVPGGRVRDVMFGPVVEGLSFRPLGGGNACKVSFRIVVCIPECSGGTNATKYQNALMEVVYRYSVTRDRAGYSRRTMTGQARIPLTKVSATSTKLADHADRYLEKVLPACPANFVRETVTWDVDESKALLRWTVVDVQLGAQRFPPGVIDCTVSHSMESDLQRGFLSWTATITGEYKLERGAERTKAWGHFRELAYGRLAYTEARAVKENGKGCAIATRLTIDEVNAYGEEMTRFLLSYRYVTTYETILSASGLWLPVPNSNDQLWRQSLAGSVFNPRGHAGLRFGPNDDVLINLCNQASVPRLGGAIQNFVTPMGKLQVKADQVTPQTSWLAYDVGFDVERDDGTVEHNPIGTNQVELKGGGAAFVPPVKIGGGGRIENNQAGGAFTSQEGQPPPYTGGVLAVLQQTPPGALIVTLWGRALRAAYPITPPFLDRVGGVKATPANLPGLNGVRSWICFNAGGIPIVACVWRLRYLLADSPVAPILPPVNPQLM